MSSTTPPTTATDASHGTANRSTSSTRRFVSVWLVVMRFTLETQLADDPQRLGQPVVAVLGGRLPLRVPAERLDGQM